jgi:hypothetical protein
MNEVINNLFTNITNTTKNKSITESSSDYSKKDVKYVYPTPGLNQGDKFKNYQKKISKNLEKDLYKVNSKEGFGNLDNSSTKNSGQSETGQSETRQSVTGQSVSLFKETKKVIRETDYSSQQDSINSLKEKYNEALNQYNNLLEEIQKTSHNYLKRVNPNNPYLGKNIYSTVSPGPIGYVTMQGVFKWYANWDVVNATAGKNGCPVFEQSTYSSAIAVNVPIDYNNPGAIINTSPPLMVGTPMESGQSCGNEGINVFVNKFMNKSSTINYEGCYQDNATSPTMTFIGGAPTAATEIIQNGSFTEPQIGTNSYNYINDSSTVPGWTISNAALINQSQAWSYPMPYPSGEQCISIQMTSSINQTIQLTANKQYTLTFSACGRNCCDGSGLSNPINIFLNASTSTTNNNQNQIYSFTANVSGWANYSTNFTVSSTGNYFLIFQGTWSNSDRSTALQKIKIIPESGSTQNISENGTYSYEACKQSATESGYQYFALQNVNPSTALGYCGVSNSQPAVTKYGTSYIPSKQIILWSTNTGGQTGNTATLTSSGTLSILNSSGSSIYSTDSSAAQPSNYLGCYNDCSQGRGLPDVVALGVDADYNYEKCAAAASEKGYSYFGLQFTQSTETSECWLGNDINLGRSMGKATNCTLVNNAPVGGNCSNAIYTTKPNGNYYFLILQDDGNMCVYRGTGPNDNQGEIWCSSTNGQQQKPNPIYQASASKYGQNWIASGSILAVGDFIGSNDGSIYLIMQPDGNLVLYTSQNQENCTKMSDGKTGGGSYANALYNLGQQAIYENMGQVAYIDPNAEMHLYDTSDVKYKNKYTRIMGNNPGNDISGAMYGNATLEQCKATCNSMDDCGGFVYDNNNQVCWPKNNNIFPNSSITPNSDNNNFSTYLRNKGPLNTPKGVSTKVKNTDTITFKNYINGGNFADKYGLAKITSVQQQQLEQLESTMDSLSSQLSELTGNYMNSNDMVDGQAMKNKFGLQQYLNELNVTDTKIKNFTEGATYMLDDSNIVVLQKNYDYLLWSTLAIGAVIISMSVMKK